MDHSVHGLLLCSQLEVVAERACLDAWLQPGHVGLQPESTGLQPGDVGLQPGWGTGCRVGAMCAHFPAVGAPQRALQRVGRGVVRGQLVKGDDDIRT